jgi:hypothetical protein
VLKVVIVDLVLSRVVGQSVASSRATPAFGPPCHSTSLNQSDKTCLRNLAESELRLCIAVSGPDRLLSRFATAHGSAAVEDPDRLAVYCN